ncbi:MAG: aminotransferase class V-fold PLP-dependent enzyme [Steroidobacteraceae bacterium]|nr:aminotransferase class V-fold PLP-dependent enzyme [Steroidobacteraceae bacterium]
MTPKPAGDSAELVLLCPGPVMLSPGVKAALTEGGLGHRDERFSMILSRLRGNCARVLGAGEDHSVLFVTGPATAGIEAACASLIPPGSVVIVPVNGTFSQRIVEILAVHGIRCVAIDCGFGQPVDLARVEQAMLECRDASGFVAVAMTHHETSAGVLNPVAAVGALARRHGARTFVDATSSAGAEDLDLVRDHVDVCITASGKCLHSAPGIAIVAASRDLLAARASAEPRSYALDLVRHHRQIEANSQTPFTPAVPLIVALDRAVEELLLVGVATRRAQYLRRRAYLEAGLRRLGLSLLRHPAGNAACSILTVAVPEAMGFEALFREVRKRGYLVYGAKPPLDQRYFQVAVMGELSDDDLAGFLAALESVLAGAVAA